MRLTRREFTILTLGAGLGGALGLGFGPARARSAGAAQATGVPTWFDWKPVADGAWVASGEGGNALALASGGEALVVDAKNAGFGTALRREAEAISGARVARLVNTHHHGDHTGGNSAFGGLPVLAHENAPPRIREQHQRYLGQIRQLARQPKWPDKAASELVREDAAALAERMDELTPDDFAPGETMGAEKSLRVGGIAVELRHVGAGHTDNDVFVHVPELNLVHTGDLLFRRLHPYIDLGAGATIDGWRRSLDAMIALCDGETVVVPGHGPLTDVDGLREQQEYFEILRRYVRQGLELGLGRDAIAKLETPELTAYGFEQLRERNMGIVYDELAAAE